MTIIDDKKISTKLRKRAAFLQLSQGALSKKTHLAQNRISEFFAGKRGMNEANVRKLANSLGMKLICKIDVVLKK